MATPDHTTVVMPQRGNTDPPPNKLQERQSQEKQPVFADSSEPLFFMYQKMAEDEDNKMAERWQKSAKDIIIFTGLFSASVAVLLAVTVLDLKPNPQDTSAFYLENMYKLQVLADPNISRPFIPSTPAEPPPFSPPKYIIWVNSLWFLSLVISLTCAMLATLLQQWARRYLRITQPPRYTPQHRARIRAFYADGVDRLRLSWAVGALPSMIHLSLLLFFTGLLIYLFNVSHPVFFAVVWWIGLSTVAYLGITFMPIFLLESPYYTPLTSIVGFLRNKEKMAEEAVEKMKSKIDGRILEWTCDTLVEDDELEKFFEMMPGFCNSDTVQDHPDLSQEGRGRMTLSLLGLLFHGFWSNSLSDSEKSRRFVICVKAADAARLPKVVSLILSYPYFLWLLSTELAESLKSQAKHDHEETNLCAQSLVARVIADVQGSDDRWVALATDQLGGNLPRYLEHGKDSVLLANLIHITRLIFHSLEDNRDVADISAEEIFPSLFEFDIRNTLPELQHEFCALWDEVVQNSTNPDSAIKILVRIRHLYIDLHQGTDAAPTAFDASTPDDDPILLGPSSYPSCHLPDHHSSEGDDTTGDTAHNLATPTIPSPPLNPTHTGTHPTDLSFGDVPETSTPVIPVTTSSGPASRTINIPSGASQDIAADDIPSQAKPTLQSNLSGGTSPQATDQTSAAIVPPAVVPSSPSSPPLLPAPSSVRGGLHSPIESSKNESDRIPQGPVSSSSSSITTFSRIAPQVASSSGRNVITAISPHSNVQDANVPTEPELLRNPASDRSATEES